MRTPSRSHSPSLHLRIQRNSLSSLMATRDSPTPKKPQLPIPMSALLSSSRSPLKNLPPSSSLATCPGMVETKAWRDAGIHVYPALGNHELNGGDEAGINFWWAHFPELKGSRWYSVRIGNCLVLSLDS